MKNIWFITQVLERLDYLSRKKGRKYSKELEIGARIVLDALNARLRILPLNPQNIELQE